MTAQTIMLLLIVGLMAGMLSGLIGIGGGIIIVPALVYVLGYSQQQAQGTSLGLLLLP
ncbi:MAG TPA: permease, partial [Chitinophagaceae bacterium]|nr:permease [Chitinophagaceae bacterium]